MRQFGKRRDSWWAGSHYTLRCKVELDSYSVLFNVNIFMKYAVRFYLIYPQKTFVRGSHKSIYTKKKKKYITYDKREGIRIKTRRGRPR